MNTMKLDPRFVYQVTVEKTSFANWMCSVVPQESGMGLPTWRTSGHNSKDAALSALSSIIDWLKLNGNKVIYEF